jgi:hypothetical protein
MPYTTTGRRVGMRSIEDEQTVKDMQANAVVSNAHLKHTLDKLVPSPYKSRNYDAGAERRVLLRSGTRRD